MCVLNKQGGKQLQISPSFFLLRKIICLISNNQWEVFAYSMTMSLLCMKVYIFVIALTLNKHFPILFQQRGTVS